MKRTVSEEEAARVVDEEKLTKLKSSVSAFDELAAKLVELDKCLEATSAKMVSLKE